MKSTLIVATLFAAAVFAGSSTLPAFAATNNDDFQQSAEGNKGGGVCTTYLEIFKSSSEDMKSTNKELRKLARDHANMAINQGFKYGWPGSAECRPDILSHRTQGG